MKKKISIIGMFVLAIIALSGCGYKAQDDFVSTLKKEQKEKYNASTIDLKVNNFEFQKNNEASKDLLGLGAALDELSISGDSLIDSSDQSMAVKLQVKAIVGKKEVIKMPLEVIRSGKEMYMSTDIFNMLLLFAQSMSNDKEATSMDYSKLIGKYVDIVELSGSSTEMTAYQQQIEKQGELVANAEKIGKDFSKAGIAYFEGLQPNRITKKNGTFVASFSKKDIVEMSNKMMDVVKKQEDFKEGIPEVDVEELLDSVYDELATTMYYNPKNKNMTMVMKVVLNKDLGDLHQFTMTVNAKNKKSKDTVEKPSKKDILSNEEFQRIIGKKSVETPETSEKEKVKEKLAGLSDEEFDAFLNEMQGELNGLDDADKQILLNLYKDVFTKEQYEKFEQALK